MVTVFSQYNWYEEFPGENFQFADIIEQKGALVYSNGTNDENLLVLITAKNGIKYIARYKVIFMFKNAVEIEWLGASIFKGSIFSYMDFSYLYYGGSYFLQVLDIDDKEGTITVRYSGSLVETERIGKLYTFKRTNKFNGKIFEIYQ